MPSQPSLRRHPRPPAGTAPQPDQVDPAARVLRRFRVVFNAVKTHFQQVEKKAGVGGLAKAMDIHQTTASNLVKAMVASDLVVARRQAIDRRATQLRLTPAGARVLKRAPVPYAGVLPQALAALDIETLDRLDSDLGKLLEVLQADERGAGIPLARM